MRQLFARLCIVRRSDSRFLVIHNMKEDVVFCKGMRRNRYEFPGGKLDPNESASDAMIRETKEEVDLNIPEGKIRNLDEAGVVTISIDGSDWIGDFGYVLYDESMGEPKIMEPEKFDDLKWVTLKEFALLPQVPALAIDIAREVAARLL